VLTTAASATSTPGLLLFLHSCRTSPRSRRVAAPHPLPLSTPSLRLCITRRTSSRHIPSSAGGQAGYPGSGSGGSSSRRSMVARGSFSPTMSSRPTRCKTSGWFGLIYCKQKRGLTRQHDPRRSVSCHLSGQLVPKTVAPDVLSTFGFNRCRLVCMGRVDGE
jgi:hypothetical protein